MLEFDLYNRADLFNVDLSFITVALPFQTRPVITGHVGS